MRRFWGRQRRLQVGVGVIVRGFRVKVFGLGGGGVRVRCSVLRAWAVLGFVELRAAAAIGTGGH